MLSIVVKNKIRHTLFLSGSRHQPEKTGIFLIGNPSSHCLKNSSLNNTSLYADFLPLAPPQSQRLRLAVSFAASFTPVGLRPHHRSVGFSLRLCLPTAVRVGYPASLDSPLATPVGETSSPPKITASPPPLPLPYWYIHTSIYTLKYNTYLLSRTIGYGIQATLHHKVPTMSFITYPFLTSL